MDAFVDYQNQKKMSKIGKNLLKKKKKKIENFPEKQVDDISEERYEEIKESGVSEYVREFANSTIEKNIEFKMKVRNSIENPLIYLIDLKVLHDKMKEENYQQSWEVENFGDNKRRALIAEERKNILKASSCRNRRMETGVSLTEQEMLVNSVFAGLKQNKKEHGRTLSALNFKKNRSKKSQNIHVQRGSFKVLSSDHDLNRVRNINKNIKMRNFYGEKKLEKSNFKANSEKRSTLKEKLTLENNLYITPKSQNIEIITEKEILISPEGKRNFISTFNRSVDGFSPSQKKRGNDLFIIKPVKALDRKFKFSGNDPEIVEMDNTRAFHVIFFIYFLEVEKWE